MTSSDELSAASCVLRSLKQFGFNETCRNINKEHVYSIADIGDWHSAVVVSSDWIDSVIINACMMIPLDQPNASPPRTLDTP